MDHDSTNGGCSSHASCSSTSSEDESSVSEPAMSEISVQHFMLEHAYQSINHPMSLTDDDSLPLLTSEFWIRPVYEELLHAASRFNLSSGAELKRPTSNLVKIASRFKDKPSDMMNSGDQHTTMTVAGS